MHDARVIMGAAGWLACGLLAWSGFNADDYKHFSLGCGDKSHARVMWQNVVFVPGGPIALFVAATMTGGFQEGFRFDAHGDWCGEDGAYVDRCWGGKHIDDKWCDK